MFKLFGRSRFLDADIEDWVLETWAWLMANLGGMERLQGTRFVLASRDYFPPTDAEGHARALFVFDRVKMMMGLAEWPCELEPFDRPDADQRVALIGAVKVGQAPGGTFRIEDRKVIISYASDLVARPRHLIAVFAHELAHYLLATVRKPIPGGQDLHELATELAVAYAGFGLFAANAAFDFEQHQDVYGQGWRSRGLGYFSERTWAFAIALLAALKGVEAPFNELKPSVAGLTGKAARYLGRHPELLAPLRAIA